MQVLEGLQYLHHNKRVVHRDIKPSNLLINAWAEVKLSDFGVSGQLTQSIADCSSWVSSRSHCDKHQPAQIVLMLMRAL